MILRSVFCFSTLIIKNKRSGSRWPGRCVLSLPARYITSPHAVIVARISTKATMQSAFLSVLTSVCALHNWVCHAYCLMDNHYHLLIEAPDGNLSKGMRQLNGVYTQNCNRLYGRVGHVFQGRYKAILERFI